MPARGPLIRVRAWGRLHPSYSPLVSPLPRPPRPPPDLYLTSALLATLHTYIHPLLHPPAGAGIRCETCRRVSLPSPDILSPDPPGPRLRAPSAVFLLPAHPRLAPDPRLSALSSPHLLPVPDARLLSFLRIPGPGSFLFSTPSPYIALSPSFLLFPRASNCSPDDAFAFAM
ncbi:hypothetical protein B0H10DRAFT_2221219 [Mycena sp. CBHHK59/15]|nr:hypothetical protein B0H10DRAFT_2221219 [Mycena sp. CBHHK59/15]